MPRVQHVRRGFTGHRVGESHHRARAPDNDVELARALRDEGLSYRAIAEKFETSPWTVRDWCTYRTRT